MPDLYRDRRHDATSVNEASPADPGHVAAPRASVSSSLPFPLEEADVTRHRRVVERSRSLADLQEGKECFAVSKVAGYGGVRAGGAYRTSTICSSERTRRMFDSIDPSPYLGRLAGGMGPCVHLLKPVATRQVLGTVAHAHRVVVFSVRGRVQRGVLRTQDRSIRQ